MLLGLSIISLIFLDSSLSSASSPACRNAIFQCQDKAGVTHGKNLIVLREEKRSLRWIKKHCGEPLDRDPFRCDWKKTVRSRTSNQPSSGLHTRCGAPIPPRPSTAPSPPRAESPRASRPAAPRRPIIPSVGTQDTAPYANEIRAAAQRYRLPPDLLRAVMKIESGFNPEAISIKGAVGLMQLMPQTGRTMGVLDPRDPAQNVMGGARFIRILANRFKGDLVKVLSAYHAGSTRVKRRGGTPFASTDNYVRKVLGVYYALRDQR